jgi:NADPH:quinone reductase-like Zn-dependent oxidoreductase
VSSGAGGAVGSTAVQFAAAAGAHVIATARSEDADWCRSAGADIVFDYGDPDSWNRIAAAAPEGIDVFFERHYAFEQTFPLARGGRLVLITGIGSTVPLPLERLYLCNAGLRGFVISNAVVCPAQR